VWYSNKNIGVDLPKCSEKEFKLIIDALDREEAIAWELRQQKQKRCEGYLSNIDGVLRMEKLVLSKMEKLVLSKIEESVDSPTLKMEYEKPFYYTGILKTYTSGSKGYRYVSSPVIESVD
jgi:hypothetical protein